MIRMKKEEKNGALEGFSRLPPPLPARSMFPVSTVSYFFLLYHLTDAYNFPAPYDQSPLNNVVDSKFSYSHNHLGNLGSEPPGHGSTSWTPTLRRVINLVVTAIIVFVLLLNIFVYKLRQLHEENSGNYQVRPSAYFTEHLCRQFSLADIQLATRNFDDALVIGQGGFGKVYRGVIDNGTTTVAIKRLSSMSRQGAPEFWTEIEMLSKFRHSHLVSLIGYCDNVHEMILVYEYMLLGSLADHLHKRDRSGKSPLSWVQRLKICIGAARGLDYLHTGTSVLHRVIHRDVKSSNILLGENWAAKIADFGMSKLGPTNQSCSHVSTDVKGTFGYMDPEYYLTRRLTRKSDVYAFGVVLFEVLCGRPAVDVTLDEEQWGLAVWAKYCIKEGILDQSIDHSLRGEILPNCLTAFVKIAEQCLHNLPMKRPTMAEVMVQLEYALALQEKTTDSPVIERAFHVIADTVDSSLLEEIDSNTGGSSGIQDNNAEASAVQEIRKTASRKTFTKKVRQFFSITARVISGPLKKLPKRRRATETGFGYGQYTLTTTKDKKLENGEMAWIEYIEQIISENIASLAGLSPEALGNLELEQCRNSMNFCFMLCKLMVIVV